MKELKDRSILLIGCLDFPEACKNVHSRLPLSVALATVCAVKYEHGFAPLLVTVLKQHAKEFTSL